MNEAFTAVGIATLLGRYTTQIRATIGDHIAAGDPSAMARVDILTRGMMARGADAWTAHQRALAIMDRQLVGQASIMAYSKIYVLSAVLILCLIPLLLPVRQTKGAVGAHAIME